MGVVWIVVLVLLWACVLLPGAVRHWSDASPRSSVERFERCMGMLARSHPTVSGRQILVLDRPEQVAAASRANRAAQRRRLVLIRLTATVVSCVAAGILLGGWFWIPAAVSASALSAYVALMVHVRVRTAERRETIRSLSAERQRLRPEASSPPAGGEQVTEHADPMGGAVRIVRWDE